jgi:hypothetical protein
MAYKIVRFLNLKVNDIVYINNKKGKVLAISYSNPTFYYIECGKYTDWYCENDLEIIIDECQ